MNVITKLSFIITQNLAHSPILGSLLGAENVSEGVPVDTPVILLEVIGDLLYNLAFAILSFFLSILDFLQYIIYKLMGIGSLMSGDEYIVYDKTNPLIKLVTNEAVIKAFSIFCIVAIVLIIVYTIFAIVMSEYKAATSGDENKKSRIFGRTLRSFIMLTLFPVLFAGGILLTNALLAGFNNVFASKSNVQYTFGSILFTTSSSTANRYRTYANSGVRVPILIDFDDPYKKNGNVDGYTEEELLKIYSSFELEGEMLYQDFAFKNFDKFNKTLVYKNNQLYNASSYNGFEKFLCTPEQYYVMADFIEFALNNHLEYHIKSIKDEDIDWKYVDDAYFDKEECSLKITYKDASNLTDGASETYTITYKPSSLDVGTPISDAFDTISNILAIGDYEDNVFNILFRDPNSINVVYYETDKVYLKLSDNDGVEELEDKLDDPKYVQDLILYEKNRYDFNNTLDYTYDELKEGVYLPLLLLEERTWRADLQKYITTKNNYVVDINGTYYKVYLPDTTSNLMHKDSYNDFCYRIVDPSPVGVTNTAGNYHTTAIRECIDESHYDASGNHKISNYQLCENGVDCDENHAHYHFDGSRYIVCNVEDCTQDHYLYLQSYYKACDSGHSLSSCEKPHYHKNNNVYTQCTLGDSCILDETEHYHLIMPVVTNCTYIEEYNEYYLYTQDVTFSDITVSKVNGTISNSYTDADTGKVTEQYTFRNDLLSEVRKQVNWPQKLMNDMQAIYSDINVNLLISSGDWLTKLSTIVGASNTGSDGFSQTFDTSIIHPLGLMVSELFLNKVSEKNIAVYGEYEFESSLTENEIRSLMLAICGEKNYRQLSLQLEYFTELFNAYMEPVLEDVAYRENFDLLNGNDASTELYTYKAYLASLLMSTTCAKYLYDSAIAVVGASDFAYGILEYEDIVEEIKNEIVNNSARNEDPIYLYVNVSQSDYLMAGGTSVVVPTGIFNYNDFKNDSVFGKIPTFFTYNLSGELEVDYIRDYIQENLNYSSINDIDTITKVIDRILERLKIVVSAEQSTDIETLVSAVYKEYGTKGDESTPATGLDNDYKDYLNNSSTDANGNPKGIYQKIIKQMNEQNVTSKNPDFEYIISLEKYINNSLERWSYISIADEKSGSSLRGQLNNLTDKSKTYIESMDNVSALLESASISSPKQNLWEYLLTFVSEKMLEKYMPFIMNDLYLEWKLTWADEYINDASDDPNINPTDLNLVIPEGSHDKVISKLFYAINKTYNSLDIDVVDLFSGVSFVDKIEVIMKNANKQDSVACKLYELAPNNGNYVYRVVTNPDADPKDYMYGTDAYIIARDDSNGVIYKEDTNTPLYFKLETDSVTGKIKTDANGDIIIVGEVDESGAFIATEYDLSDITIMRKVVGQKRANQIAQDGLDEISQLCMHYYEQYSKIIVDDAYKNKAYGVGSIFGCDLLYADYNAYINGVDSLREISVIINDYLDNLKKIDSLHKYYIVEAVSAYVSTHLNTEFEVIVNGKHYTVGSNFTSVKLTEYILGAEFLKEHGYETFNFVEEDYKGLIDVVKTGGNSNLSYNLYKMGDNSFSILKDFLTGFGDTSTRIFNISNFNNLAATSIDELVIAENPDLMRFALEFLLENDYLPADILAARFGLESVSGIYEDVKVSCQNKLDYVSDDELRLLFENVYDYLFINETNDDVDLLNMTLKDLRIYTIDFIINYEKLNESVEQNQKRYLALFNLACADWTMDNDINTTDYTEENVENITGLSPSNASMGVVLKLAGIENRPYEELVDLEYTIDFEFDRVDEANGDVFVICTYDENTHTYIPFMMTNNKDYKSSDENMLTQKGMELIEEDGKFITWYEKFGQKLAVTDYLAAESDDDSEPLATLKTATVTSDASIQTVFSPIIARGVFDSSGNPTAIRRVNGNIEFYRDDVVIRNDSEIGLSQYYDSAEAVYNEQGFVANVVNTVTKLFTGKSLAERMLEKFPRLAVTAGVELAYGVDDLMVECMEESKTTLTYSFGSGSVSMGSMYNMKEINLVLLFIAVISVFGFVMKALWGVIGRLFDILVLFILGPVAISTVALKSDSKDKSGQFVEGGDLVAGAYDQWKKTLIDRILLAFGYIFGLNVFFILVPMISNIQMFTETSMFAGVPMFGELPLGLANAIGSLIFLISLSSIITYAPALLSKIMDFQNAVQYGSIVQNRVKNVVKEAQDGITGRKMMDGMAKTWENAKNFVPGIAQMKIVKDKISKDNTKFKMNHMKKQALKNGVDPKVAEEAVKAYKASLDQQKKNKATRNKEKAEARRKRDEERQRFDEV